MNDGAPIATLIYKDWAEIQRVLAIKRGEHWDDEVQAEMTLVIEERPNKRPLLWFKYGGLSYARLPETQQIFESRIEEKGVLVSVFDPDGELAEASTVPLENFKLIELE